LRRALALAAALAFAAPAGALVPAPGRLVAAAARANGEAGRAVPLRLGVALHTELPGEGATPIATGELVSEPGGPARLELVGRNGVREEHVLSQGRIRATRDGEVLAEPRALLPPVWLLQLRRSGSLRSALRRMGVDVGISELRRSPDRDCFVVGVRSRGPEASAPPRPSVWLDAYSFEIVRFDRGDGARFRLGPTKSFGERQLPAWISLEQQGKPPLYLELRSASPAPSGAARPASGAP
jgi:hypothetical protein